MNRKKYYIVGALLASALAGAVAWQMPHQTASNGTSTTEISAMPTKAPLTNAIWDWDTPVGRTDEQLAELGAFLKKHGFTASYIAIDGFVSEVHQQTDPKKQASARATLEAHLARYVLALKQHDVQVYAAGGDVEWSRPQQQPIPAALLAFAHDFNLTHPEAELAGFMFDIEPYSQEGFFKGGRKQIAMAEYLEMVSSLTSQTLSYPATDKTPLSLGFAVPFWFDSENPQLPPITWNGSTQPAFMHLAQTLNRLPASQVVVMAYRNQADGVDGVNVHIEDELAYADAMAKNVNIIVGQEVSEVEPAKISYFGKTPAYLTSQKRLIEEKYGKSPALAGYAINDLVGWRKFVGE